jgi:hypothetical protein
MGAVFYLHNLDVLIEGVQQYGLEKPEYDEEKGAETQKI